MNMPTLPAALAMLWMATVSVAIFYLTWEKPRKTEPDLWICPLCDRSTRPSSHWNLHPSEP